MNKFSRWYRFNNTGVKFVINCEIGKKPEPVKEHGFTEWKRGPGPEVVKIKLKKHFKKPKVR